MRRPVSLRTYLLFLVLGAMLPGAALTTFLIYRSFADSRAVVERRLADAARVDAAALDRIFADSIEALTDLAGSPSLDHEDLAAFHQEGRRAQLARPAWYSVLLLAPDGRQLVNTRVPWGTPLFHVNEPVSFDQVLVRRTPAVGSLRYAQRDHTTLAFPVRVPVLRGDEVRYVLTALITADALRGVIVSTLPISDEWTRTIVDAEARVAARTRDADRFIGQPSTPSFASRVRHRLDGVVRETSLDGSEVYAALAFSQYGWSTAVIVPRSVLDAPLRASTMALAGGGLLLMLGTFAALFLVSRRLTSDLDAAVTAAVAVARGTTLPAAPVHVVETARLHESLADAASLLRQREAERDAEVRRAEAAREEAELANRTKDHFLAVLGHELRNPLAPALTALELMERIAPDVCQRERQVLDRQVRHLVRLVDDLLDVSRLARGKIDLRWSRVHLHTVLGRAVDMVRPLMQRRRHRLTVDEPATTCLVDGDEDRLVQVLVNLLTNAARYTPEGGAVRLVVERDGANGVSIACEDNGPGVPDELRPTLFDAFVQGARPLDGSSGGGLGLGLALARRFIDLHGGRIDLETPASGRGSRFVVHLPRAHPDAAPQPDGPAASPAAMTAVRPQRVLLVDDNRDALDMLRYALEQAGHQVTAVGDGSSALDAAATFQPETALLDIDLPGMNGYELAARLKASFPRIRLIALTGFGQAGDRQRARQAGFAAHCTKPVPVTDLLRCVQETLHAGTPVS